MATDSNLQDSEVTIRRHSSHQSLLRPTFLSTIARAVLVKTCCNLCHVLARRNRRKRGKYIPVYYNYIIIPLLENHSSGGPPSGDRSSHTRFSRHTKADFSSWEPKCSQTCSVTTCFLDIRRSLPITANISTETLPQVALSIYGTYTCLNKEYNRFLLVSRYVVARISCKYEG